MLKDKMSIKLKLSPTTVASEPASPTKSEGKEMEVAPELGSPTLHGENIGLLERGLKTMLSIRKSKRSLKKEKEQEGTGTLRKKRLSFLSSKSYEENKTTVPNDLEEVVETIETEPIEGKPLSGKKQNICNPCRA